VQNQINLNPISQFAQMLRAAELSQSKELKMPIQQARMLSLALNEMQDKLLQDYSELLMQLKNSSANEVISISMDGGGFKD
jgi:hypothetical protein